MSPKVLAIDMDYVREVMVELLAIPSVTGRTDDVMHAVGGQLRALGIDFRITRLGAIDAQLKGEQDSPDRAVVAHADTVGCAVRHIKPNGRLSLVPIGTFSARFAEGARARLFLDQKVSYTGTILPRMASGHAYNELIDTQGVGWEHVELRLDERTASVADTEALGIQPGDFVALEPHTVITPSGYVVSRHLDDKAGLASALGAFKAVLDHGIDLPVTTHLLVTTREEIGQGASAGLATDVTEMVSVDVGIVAPEQSSREDTVNIAMVDQTGPFDFHLSRKLARMCREFDIPVRRDVFAFYRSDVAAALEAGVETRAALIGCGVDASHGHERTHLDGIRRVAELLAAYLQTPLTFPWDAEPTGQLEDFPRLESESPLEP